MNWNWKEKWWKESNETWVDRKANFERKEIRKNIRQFKKVMGELRYEIVREHKK